VIKVPTTTLSKGRGCHDMETEQLKEIIRKLNYPRRGSFGEYIYKCTLKNGHEIVPKHDGSVDFRVNGINVDVKSHELFKHTAIPQIRAKNKKKDIVFNHVIFLKDETVICDEDGKILYKCGYDRIIQYFLEWKRRHHQDVINPGRRKLPQYISERIEDFFRQNGKIVRIISRTNIRMWGKDAPDNLCKPLRRKVDVTVFLAFKGDNHNLEEIEYIFAFPQSHCNRLPKLSPEIGSYRQGKVDMPNSPPEYKFKSLAELYDTFFKRFANG